MRILYIECNMGAAGDMLMAALLELCESRESFVRKMNSLGIPDICVTAEDAVKCGIKGTRIRVKAGGAEEHSQDASVQDAQAPQEHVHGHHHAGLTDICKLIDSLNVSEKVKTDAKAVYRLLADAESRVHGTTVSDIHFHEVGTKDAVADIVGVCMLMEEINAEKVFVSAVHVGSGTVKCTHGVLPVPAPATALLLEGIPAYGGAVSGELCTPTGAALLRYFGDSFGEMPVMAAEKIGYGMGGKDFGTANCLRAFIGTAKDRRETVTKLECNIDDMTGEDIGFAVDRLFEAGARDVCTVPVAMKKNRPGVMLCVICMPEDADALAAEMMKHTTTLGIRRLDMDRYVLDRSVETTDTKYGQVRIKHAKGMGTEKSKPEYDDLERIAEENGISIAEVRKNI